MRPLILTIALACVALATPSLALDGPGDLVRTLYKLESIPLKSRDIDRYFARDLAAAIKKDIRGDEPGQTNDGDYRYNAQEFEIKDLAFKETTNMAGGNVVVTFKNIGKPETVTYNMCLARSGWKIANVLTKSSDWDMRTALKLPSMPVKC